MDLGCLGTGYWEDIGTYRTNNLRERRRKLLTVGILNYTPLSNKPINVTR